MTPPHNYLAVIKVVGIGGGGVVQEVCDGLAALRLQRAKEPTPGTGLPSAPKSLTTFCGGTTFPKDLDIFNPFSSTAKPWVNT